MAKKKASHSNAIQTHMDHPMSSYKQNSGRDLTKHPHKLAKGEVSNVQSRPPKR